MQTLLQNRAQVCTLQETATAQLQVRHVTTQKGREKVRHMLAGQAASDRQMTNGLSNSFIWHHLPSPHLQQLIQRKDRNLL